MSASILRTSSTAAARGAGTSLLHLQQQQQQQGKQEMGIEFKFKQAALRLGRPAAHVDTVDGGGDRDPGYGAAVLPGAVAAADPRNEHYDRRILSEMGSLGLLGATIQGHG
ncbi:hypothetical protein KEM55_000701, partial [Ascosphaera atra]